MNDRPLFYAAVFARALATGMIGVLLGVYLAELDLDPGAIGVVVAAGLAGATLATLAVTVLGDRFGRRRSLIALTILSAVGAAALALSTHPLALAIAAFIGMVNGMGRDRGAALVLEQSALPATTSDRERTMTFAQYNVLQDVGHALGSLAAGLPSLLTAFDAPSEQAFRWTIFVYAALCVLPLFAYRGLSRAIESAHRARPMHASPESRSVLTRLSLLFGLDSLAGGFLTTALLSYFFYERFGVSVGVIGLLFFLARIANAGSHFAAAWLARRIGLVNTMVFTHIPSSLLLITVPFAPSFPVAAGLFLLRESLVEMDVPTRQSYVMAMVRAEERTLASGVTHLVRLAGWAIAPAIAGLMMSDASIATPLYVGAGMKITYDVLLWRSFRALRPPEERGHSTRAGE